jgi:hypothetical protein
MKIKPGERVIVRDFHEIMGTLDSNGFLDGLPYMQEMIPYCGKEFRVYKRADRTCIEPVEIRQMQGTVFLENLRCGGEYHGNCQKGCMFFWKEAWLRSSGETDNPAKSEIHRAEPNLRTMTADGRYICQSTELKRATQPLPEWSGKRIFGEYTAGNVSLTRLSRYIAIPVWIRFQRFLKRTDWPDSIYPKGECVSTPVEEIGLQAGDWVDVKSRSEIEMTLDPGGRNRGLEFTPMMVPFCGQRLRVRNRVQRMILEKRGEMIEMKNTVILEGATCDGHTFMGGCPRDTFHLWREVWLRKIEPSQ